MLKKCLQPVNLLPLLLLITVFAWVILPLRAQDPQFMIAYGETQSAIFADNAPHEWQFTGASRDIITLRVQRISGQFIPAVALLDANGQELAVSADNRYVDTAEIIFSAGLPNNGAYTLQISGANLLTNPVDNPDEYALTLLKTGQRKANLDDGLAVPLPDVINAPLPDVLMGTPNTDNVLEIPVYGEAILERPDARLEPNRFTLTLGRREIVIQNASPSPVNPVLEAVSFLPDGIGMIVTNDRLLDRRPIFFTDQNFEIAYDSPNRVWTFRLANGQTIVSDFDQVDAILALENLVVVVWIQTGEVQHRAIFEGELIDIRRRARQPISEAPITEIQLEGGRYINTDLRGIQAIAYRAEQLQVFYSADARLLTDVVQIEALTQLSLSPDSFAYTLVMQNPARPEPLSLQYDLVGMGDVTISDTAITLAPLDGRRISEPLATTRNLLMEQAGIRFQRSDDSPNRFRLSLPDGTEIETPAPVTSVDLALPHEVGYVPRGFNNLGTDPIAYCPCLTETLENVPVNPANGNFYYAVTDFAIPSHTLALAWTRHYNSLAAAGAALTPDYMLNTPQAYLLQQLGKGWRHSYQYELDLTTAPLDVITLILPDGARHRFTADAPSATRFTSRTLLSWVLDRVGGSLGSWQATRSDGIQYAFDRAGRLQRIIETPHRTLAFLPAPKAYSGENSGFFVIEPYGRRLEIYTGTSGRIERVRDTLLREITYTYERAYIIGVQYYPDAVARYTYNETELLETYIDVRSPYTQSGRLGYDGRSRVIVHVENPANKPREYRYEYNPNTPLVTRRTQTIGEIDKQWVWEYGTRWQLLIKRLPGAANLNQEFRYDSSGTILTEYEMPNQGVFRYQFDNRGNLIQLKDPIVSVDNDEFNLTYEQRGVTSLLTRIQYAGQAEDLFTYTADAPPRLQTHQRLVQPGNTTTRVPALYQVTRYEYDAWGRLILQVAPGADATFGIGTVYQYDAFGYPSEIWQGIITAPEETFADMTVDRAQRIVYFQHDILGQLRAVTDGRGSLYTLNYEAQTGRLHDIQAPHGVQRTYLYDERGNIIAQQDRGQNTQYAYDAFDRLIGITNALGNQTTYQYDAADNLIAITDAVGRTTTYAYDAQNQLINIIPPNGLNTRFSTFVDTENTRIERRAMLPNDRIILWRYDALNRIRLIEITEKNTRQDFFIDYNQAGFPVEIRSSFTGRTLRLTYNAAGWLTQTTIAGLSMHYEYDLAGNLIRITTPGGQTTTIAYDAMGNVANVVTPPHETGTAVSLEYDAEGNLITKTDASGLITQYFYDALNQLVTTTDAAGNAKHFSYDVRGNLIGLMDPMQHERHWIYDALDQVTTVNAGLYQSQYEYDAVGRLLTITQPEGFTPQGRTLRLSYAIDDTIIASNITPGQLRTLYTYDALGRLTSTTDPKGHTTVYAYNASDKLSQIIDALGNTQDYTWSNNTLATYTDAEGNAYEYTMDEFGRLARIADETGEIPAIRNVDFRYSPDGYLTEMVIRPERVTNPDEGIRHQYEYDSDGHILRYIDPLGSEWQFEYDAMGRRVAMIDPMGSITRYGYDTIGRINQVIRAADTSLQAIETYDYDANGNIIRYTAPTGIIHTYDYDANRNLIRAVLATGTDVETHYHFRYNGQGQLFQKDDPNGLRTCYFYRLDKLRRIEIRSSPAPLACDQSDPDAEKINFSYAYDDAGNLISITLPAVNASPAIINLAYDALNRRVRYVDPTASVWSYTYDRAGNLRQISDPAGNITDYEYNSYYQVTRVIFPTLADVVLGYDQNGNLNTVRLPQGSENTARQTLTYLLDTAGNLLEIRDEETLVRQFEYNARGQVISRLEADDRITCYDYDAAGRLITTTYQTRPPCGAATNVAVIHYGYDLAGNLISVEPTNDDPIAMSYDAHHRLKTFQQGGISLAYDYDALGNVLRRAAGNGDVINYRYDAYYRLIGIEAGDISAALKYDDRNQLIELSRSNGVITRYSYDAAGRVNSLAHFDANEVLDGFVYQYDSVGNLIGADRVADNWRMLYSYDVMNRLIDERWLNDLGATVYTLSIRYDAAGNRTEVTRNGIRTQYRYNEKNQLVQATRSEDTTQTPALPLSGLIIIAGSICVFPLMPRRNRARMSVILAGMMSVAVPLFAQINPDILRVEYQYDAAGNVQTIDYVYIEPIVDANGTVLIAPDGTPRTQETSYQLVFEYDWEQRLIAVTGADENGKPVALRLDYDPLFSQPITWAIGDETSYRLYYDGILPLALENTTQGDSVEQIVSLSPQEHLFTRTNTGEILWNLNDITHTPRRFVNNEGELLTTSDKRLEFNGFGERIYPYPDYPLSVEAQVTEVMPFFAGQLFDPATGYSVMGLRVYDPHTARFLQPDPIRQDIYGTLYTYAQNRPTILQDTMGLTAEPYLDPTQIMPDTADLHPESLIPQPYQPDVPLPEPTTAVAQKDEFFRAWQLIHTTQYGINDRPMQLAPALDALYVMNLYPLPPAAKNQLALPINAVMALYTPGQGWLTNLAPDPYQPRDPFVLFETIAPLLAQTQQHSLAFCQHDHFYGATPLLPQVTLPTAFTQQAQLEMALLTQLQPTALMNSVLPEVTSLANITTTPLITAPSLGEVQLPEVEIAPPLLTELEALRDQQRAFFERILNTGIYDQG